jgi:hypothetical protein
MSGRSHNSACGGNTQINLCTCEKRAESGPLSHRTPKHVRLAILIFPSGSPAMPSTILSLYF